MGAASIRLMIALCLPGGLLILEIALFRGLGPILVSLFGQSLGMFLIIGLMWLIPPLVITEVITDAEFGDHDWKSFFISMSLLPIVYIPYYLYRWVVEGRNFE